ncbi:MAG TPA: hypothetical protein VFA75_15260 [Nevskia sp.]|jgi:hypothetical protein|nr:hypothetical protein [Nevskia sp.]
MSGLLLFHGALVLLAGLLAGAPYGRAIAAGAPARRAEAWRAAHAGLIGTGLITLVFGLMLRAWRAQGTLIDMAAASAIASAWAFSAAMVLAAASGQRGLSAGGPLANRLVFAGYVVGVLGSLGAAAGFAVLAWNYRGV